MSFVQAANAAFVYIHSVVRSILQLCFLNPDTSDTWMLDKPWYTNFIEPRNHQVFYFHDAIILLKLKNFYLNLVVKSHIYIYTGWWLQTFFHNIWDVILPIDFHIFQDG